MKYIFYADASKLFSFYEYDIMYNGDVTLYIEDSMGIARKITSGYFDKKSGSPEEWVESEIFKKLPDFDISLDDKYIAINDYAKIVVVTGEDEDCDISVENLEMLETKCSCACGQEVTHKKSPIPRGV